MATLISNSELMHYGVPGMKWGVRRYQNKDGSLTELGTYRYRAMKAYRTKEDVDRVYNSLSDHDRYLLGDDENSTEYLSADQGEWVVKRFIDRHKDTPVAFLDLMTTTKEGELTVCLATDPDYRGQGRAGKLLDKSIKWFEKNAKEQGYDRLTYSPRTENKASQHVAERAGFKEYERDSDWVKYKYESKR